MNTPSCTNNSYGAIFQTHDHSRDQSCIVYYRIISSGNYIFIPTDPPK